MMTILGIPNTFHVEFTIKRLKYLLKCLPIPIFLRIWDWNTMFKVSSISFPFFPDSSHHGTITVPYLHTDINMRWKLQVWESRRQKACGLSFGRPNYYGDRGHADVKKVRQEGKVQPVAFRRIQHPTTTYGTLMTMLIKMNSHSMNSRREQISTHLKVQTRSLSFSSKDNTYM
jgi:hypothetical protein